MQGLISRFKEVGFYLKGSDEPLKNWLKNNIVRFSFKKGCSSM